MPLAAKHKASSHSRPGQASTVEMSALVSLHPLPDSDIARITELLENAGIQGIRSAKVVVSLHAAERLASGHQASVEAVIIAGEDPVTPEVTRALDAATRRGDALKQSLLAAPDM